MKVSFDYDGTLSTPKGQELATKLIGDGNTLYVISARSSKLGIIKKANDVGIPNSRVYATGSNEAKVQKIKDLHIDTHYDNNPDVIKALPGIGKLI